MAFDPSISEEQLALAKYHIATERYNAAVGELSTMRATLSQEDYKKLLDVVEEAHGECERIRAELAKLTAKS